jgi:predicted ester cyclase
MSVDENKATVRRWFDCFNKADVLDLEECFASGRSESDREFLKDAVVRWHVAFPDYCYHVEDLVAEGDVVAVNTLSTGTHDGVFEWYLYGPWPASGRQIQMREIFFIRLADGKIVDMTATWNPDDLREQLGVLAPNPARA